MMQTELLTKLPISTIGEEITHELGKEMIQHFQKSFPTENAYYVIGRNIIDRILAQPGCAGMRFYNACKENGQKTLVYVGVDQNGNALISYQGVNQQGILQTEKGIVADKVAPQPPTPLGRGGGIDDFESWGLPE